MLDVISKLDQARQALLEDRLDDAEAGFRSLLDPEALHGIGLIHFRRGDAAAAVPWIHTAHALEPTARSAHNLGLALTRIGRPSEGTALQRWAVANHPDYIPAWFALSDDDKDVMIELAERAARAGDQSVTRRAIAAIHDDHPRLLRLANLLRMIGWTELCRAVLDIRLRADPDDIGAHMTEALCHLTPVHADEAEVQTRRACYAQSLSHVADRVSRASPQQRAAAAGIIGLTNPFLLAYHGRNDRPLQRLYGDIVTKLAEAEAWPAAPMPAPPAAGEKIRVGFVSAWMHLHSVAKTFSGWIEQLDRHRFSVFGYQLSDARDALSERIEAGCDGYLRAVAPARAWRDHIVADAPHVLIYLDVGMEQTAPRLAARRLAPVQCVTWGHPVTTGLPTMDYYLSSALMEPPDGDKHYTEKLIRLPGHSMWYEPLTTKGGQLTRADLGLPDDAVVYLSCQSLFKYRPCFDDVFPAIAYGMPQARFLFLAQNGLGGTAIFRERLENAFSRRGMDWRAHCVLANPVTPDQFPSLLDCADVFLDSLGWSGCNTTLEAITRGLPVVTMPGTTMRGRHSAAMMEGMGLSNWVAATEAEYVGLARELATPIARVELAQAIVARRERLFRDPAPVRALEDFLEEAVRGAPVAAADVTRQPVGLFA